MGLRELAAPLVLQRTNFAPAEMIENRGSHKFFRAADCTFQPQAGGKAGGNSRRVGAARSMGCHPTYKRRSELGDFSVSEEQIDRSVSGQMSSLQQNRDTIFFGERPHRPLH